MKYGEIVNLGRHKLMCGDATKREDVLKLVGDSKIDLVLTDPPYGINVQHKDGTIGSGKTSMSGLNHFGHDFKRTINNYEKIFGDDSTDNARKNYEIINSLTKNFIIWGGQYFANFLPVSGGWIFWDKLRPNTLDFGSGELAYNLCSNVVKKYSHKWNGAIREGSKNLNPRPLLHPSQKPVELHMKILQDFSKENDIILDCFGGSGTTLIACEMVNRTCLMMEISPDYCDIICNRYKKLTDLTLFN